MVAELRDGLLEEDTVHVQVSDAARTLIGSTSMLEVTSKGHFSLDIVANCTSCNIFHKPFRLHAVNTGHIMVELLEEVDHSWHVLRSIVESSSQDGAVAAEVAFLVRSSALVNLLNRDVEHDDVGGQKTLLGHKDSLSTSLGESFKDPTSACAVCHLDTLLDKLNQKQVVKISAEFLQLLTDLSGEA